MIPTNTIKIVMYLLKNINEFGFIINQIAKLNNISVGSAFKILKNLEKNSILLNKNISNASHFKLNFDNPETNKLCELLLLMEKRSLKGYAKIYAKDIVKFEEAKMIIIFGSVLKNQRFNDVDVLFLTNKTKKVNDFCLNLSKIRTKPVVPLILQQKDLIKAIKVKNEAILDLIKKGIILKGESVFVRVIKHVNS